ncbi:MAG TPA: hypothetical protein VM009_00065 [Terriglobales bacterium]|nr:hypothetical protein [Terriglobales bacterium]
MVRFECDGCGTIKKNGEPWIMGFAAENIGVTAARREVTISDVWDDRAAREWLAVHFCSDDCRADYMGKVFGETPNTQVGRKTIQTKRIQRVVPGAIVETQVSSAKGSAMTRSLRGKKKAS